MTPAAVQTFRYRPELDGLRAVAVLAVLFFHADFGLPGGFVGVDVFFVLSGYLITSLIIRDLESSRFTFAEFWERRARRILPASTVLVTATLVAGSLLLMPSDFATLGSSATATAVFGANVFFWRSVDYFTAAADELPLLHMWSLAVEEQFYFGVPFLFWLCSRSRYFTRQWLLVFIGIACVVSLAMAAWMVPRMPAAAFYLLPSRAWELGLGSIVALWPPRSLPASRPARAACSWIGLAGIAVPCGLYDESTPFPGIAALPPCLGSALFILSNSLPANGPAPLPARVLSTAPAVAIGLVSYSLYLWHWPFFAFARYWALEPLSLWTRIALCAISGLVATLSWYFVETPFRTRSFAPRRLEMLTAAGISLGVLAIAGLAIRFGNGFPQRFSSEIVDLASEDLRNISARSATLDELRVGNLPILGDPADPLRLLVWGDSHAMAILPAVEQLCREKNVSACYAVHSSTAPVLGYEHTERFSRGAEAPAFAAAVIDYVRAKRVPNVLLAARWSGYFDESRSRMCSLVHERESLEADFGVALRTTVEALVEAGAQPWIFTEVPNHKVNVPKALRARMMFGINTDRYCADKAAHKSRCAPSAAIAAGLEKDGAAMVDASADLLAPSTNRYAMDADGVPIYVDQHHLSRAGALKIAHALAPCLDGNARPAPQNPRLNSGQGSHDTGITEDVK
jgi:peptidoglycan/LPS O-acetylase OafA/YrhL